MKHLFFVPCVSFSVRVSYHFAVCSSLSIAINHFETYTTDTPANSLRIWYDTIRFFFSFFFPISDIHTCSHLLIWCAPLHAYQKSTQNTTEQPITVAVVVAFCPSFSLSLDLCKIISASELCETRWQTRRLSIAHSTTQHTIISLRIAMAIANMCARTPYMHIRNELH